MSDSITPSQAAIPWTPTTSQAQAAQSMGLAPGQAQNIAGAGAPNPGVPIGGSGNAWANLLGLGSVPEAQLAGPQTGSIWQRIANNLGAEGYSALNQIGMGLPNFLVKNIAGSNSYQALQDFLQQYPLASRGGSIAGLAGSMGTGNAELKALSKVPVLGKVAQFGLGEGGNVLKQAARGVVQAAPQSLIRAATGNITPEQGAMGLAFGAGAGALGGLLGGRAAQAAQEAIPAAPSASGIGGKLAGLKDFLMRQTLGDIGMGKRMVSSDAGYGLRSNQLGSKTNAANDLVNQTYQIFSNLAKKPGGISKNLKNWIDTESQPAFNALSQAYKDAGINPPALRSSFEQLPDVKKMLSAASPELQGQAQTMLVSEPAAFATVAQDAMDAGMSPIAAIHQYATNAFDKPYLAAQGADVMPAYMRMKAGQAMMRKLDDITANSAVEQGLTTPEAIDQAWRTYPSRILIQQKLASDAATTGGINPGSDTAIKTMLGQLGSPIGGGILGYEAAPQDQKLPGAIMGTLGGLALGGGLGSFANQAITGAARNLAAKGNVRAINMLDKLAGGAPAKAATEAVAGIPGAAEGAQAIARGTPILAALSDLGSASGQGGNPTIPPESGQPNLPPIAAGGAVPPEEQNNQFGSPIAVPTVDPSTVTYKDLSGSASPWFRNIANSIQRIWAQDYAMRGVPLNQLTQEIAKNTDGFSNVREVLSSLIYRNNPQEIPNAIQNYNIASVLKGVNYKGIVDALKPVTQHGKYIGLGMNPAGNPVGNIAMRADPAERQALYDINQLAHVAGVNPNVAIADLRRIASLPNVSDAEKEQLIRRQILNVYATINHMGFNPVQMQQLGLYPTGE